MIQAWRLPHFGLKLKLTQSWMILESFACFRVWL